MFVFAGQVATVQKQEFAAEQTHAVCPGCLHGIHVLQQFNVRHQFDRGAIERGGFAGFQPLQLVGVDAPLVLPQPVFGQNRLVRIDDYHAIAAIDDQQVVIADQTPRIVQGHH